MTERIEKIIEELTLDEKAALTAGADMWHGAGQDRLGFRGLKVTDGPNGARGSYFVGTTSACLPCGTALAATWNTELVGALGHLIGRETTTKGADALLAPTVNIHRSPLAGRNFECYSEDPFLTARMAVAYITGVQSEGVAATVKHYAANESEFERHTISSEVGERALREIYLPPFEAAVTEANTRSIMTAYNRLNGTFCSEHPWLIDDVLIGEWGFEGYIVSDWLAVKSTVETGLHGVDLEMPGPPKYLGAALAQAIRDGEVPESALDAKLRRLLRVMDELGVLEEAAPRPDRSVDRPEDRVLLRRAAAEAVVLLTNDGTLPIDPGAIGSVAVVGPNADVAIIQGGGSAAVNPHHATTVLDGLRDRLGTGVVVTHARGCDSYRSAPPLDPRWTESGTFRLDYFAGRELEGDPVASLDVGTARLTWLGDPWPGLSAGDFSARLTADLVAPESGDFTFSLIAGGRGRVFLDDELVLDMWDDWRPGTAFFGLGSEEIRVTVPLAEGDRRQLRMELACMQGLPAAAGILGGIGPLGDDPIAEAAALAADADVAVVVVGLNMDWETEGQDRVSMDLPGRQDDLILAVAAANPRTVVLVNAGSVVSMPWADDVAAIAQMWYLGQESGDAIADLLVGDANPSGRLPTTFPRRYEDHPATLNYPGELGEVLYGEGVFVGYRGFERMGIEPLFPFGHGLSYTTFDYGDATVESDEVVDGGTVRVSVPVTNSGPTAGAEVVQVYVADTESRLVRPPQELKGFAKVHLAAGETATVTIPLDVRAFSYWDPDASGWVCETGEFELRVGASSSDIRSTVTVRRAG